MRNALSQESRWLTHCTPASASGRSRPPLLVIFVSPRPGGGGANPPKSAICERGIVSILPCMPACPLAAWTADAAGAVDISGDKWRRIVRQRLPNSVRARPAACIAETGWPSWAGAPRHFRPACVSPAPRPKDSVIGRGRRQLSLCPGAVGAGPLARALVVSRVMAHRVRQQPVPWSRWLRGKPCVGLARHALLFCLSW